jgi:hypothetical protein
MDDRQLNEHLSALQQELAAAKPADVRRRAQIQRMADDIRALLHAGSGGGERSEYHGLRERLSAAAAELETEHPKLTAAIERVVDTLAFYGL